MLERTATSIEPCSNSLQRVVPSARSCLQGRRKLHTSFWHHHGASELELLDACQALVRQSPGESKIRTTPAMSDKRVETMTASGLLLDFLYPSGTAALLRRPYPIRPVRLESGPRSRSHMSRLFTSSVSRRSDQSNNPQAAAEDPDALVEPDEEVDEERQDHDGEGAIQDIPHEAEEAEEAQDGVAAARILRKLLHSERVGAYDQIFQQYMKLDPSSRDEFTTDVLLAISASTRPIEAWRVNDLFSKYAVDEWTEELVRAAVKAQLTLHKVPEAMDIFRTAMEQRGFGGALDYIAAYGFELSSWNLVLEAWEIYYGIKGADEPPYEPPALTSSEPVEPSSHLQDADQGGEREPAQRGNTESGTDPAARQEPEALPESTESQTDAVSARAGEKGPRIETSSMQETVTPSLSATVPEDETQVDSSAGRDAVHDGSEAHQSPPAPENADQPAAMQDTDSGAEQTIRSPPTGGSGYPTLAATTNFEAKVKELYKYLENEPESLRQRTALVDSFLKHVVRYSLHSFRPSDVVFMLHKTGDPRSYERFIIFNAEQDQKRLANDLYRKYRALPGVRVAESVLRVMIDVYFPHNVVGMEQLLEDWYRSCGRLDERAYHKFMSFYGGRGDIKSIMRLAGEFSKHYGGKVENDPKFIRTLMQAHAVRGDPDAARQVMTDASERTGEPPTMRQWNILLNAYTKAGDYGGAIELFSYICNELEPDDYTFGTMMGMAGFRGDLQFALELYQLARDRNIQPTSAMIRALVEAYCQNDRFAEAEKLCVSVTKKRNLPGNYTMLWNALLQHHAKRRDLTTVNRLLEFMSAQGIPYNHETYSQLLLALLYARQSHHAMHLLRVAHREGVFEPTADHYVLLMAAFINSGEPHMALKTNELMASMNFPHSAMRMTKVIDALGRWQQLPYTKRLGLSGDHFLKKVLRNFYKAMEQEDQGSPDDIRSVVNLYSKVLFILTQMREHATVQQLIRLHNTRYPSRSSEETIPLKLLHQIMLADFFEKKYDRVRETWDLILRRATERYQPASSFLNPDDPERPGPKGPSTTKRVIYAQRFRLCDPLKTMQRLYLEEQDAEGLLNLVATVRKRGFDLDSKNWNYHVQALARLKRWREAFTVCEKVLMPQWTGWYAVRAEAQVKNQVPLELRRIGRNPQRPRPIAHTLLVLAKEYMDLEQMMLWSHEASREFEYINEHCPKTVRAVTTLHRSGSRLEAQIFGLQQQQQQQQQQQPDRRAGGRKVRVDEKVVRPRRIEDTAWTEGGLLNVEDPSKLRTGERDMSEEDIVSALKGEARDQGRM
ncbi:TPR-like protein [Thermothelomyces heterothallicus CBS 203.75]